MRTYTEGEIRKELRDRFTPPRGTTQKEVAKELGFSPAYIYAVLAEQLPVTPQMAKALGFEEVPRRFVKVRAA